MSEDIPRDRRVAAAVETEGLVVVPGDRAVVVPEAAPLRAATRPLPRDGSPGSNTALWVLGALVASGVALAIIIWALAPNGEVRQTGFATPVSDTVEPGSNVARGLALAAPEAIRTKTVNLRGDEDLLNLATGVGAVDSLGGAPVTADGVEVTELLGDRAFEVGNPAGNTMVVYLPYGVPGDVFVTLGQKVTFVGSLSPTSEDLTTIAGATAATAAAGEGAYIVAVPESVHVVPPSAADAA
ncbi:MAG: hypothetical protein H0W82_02330 [Actinobacteria bacterium]|nr:hypothetical protein [Actinomycetota bacterium]